MIKFVCSNCNGKIAVPDEYRGKLIRCGSCKQPARVPETSEASTLGESAIIKFWCSGCNQKIGLPAHYAGKIVKCARCKQPTRVPDVSQETEQAKPDKIKFSCPGCGQKFGVAVSYAGKKVKCPKCGRPICVPAPQDKPAAGEAGPIGVGDSEMPGPGISTDDLLAMESGGEAVQEEPRLRPSAVESARHSAQALRVGASPASESVVTGSAASAALGTVAKIPLAIGAGFGAALFGAVIWAVIACATGYELGIVAWGIGALAGLGVTLFTEGRNFRMGLMAALFAFLGIGMGKVFVAKWYIMPKIEKELSGVKPPSNVVDDMVKNQHTMFMVASFELAERKEFNEDFAMQVALAHIRGVLPEENKEQFESAREKALVLLDSWSDSDKRLFAEKHSSTIFNKFANLFMESKIGLFLAFIATFSLWDLLWFPMALWTAYKIGSGRARD